MNGSDFDMVKGDALLIIDVQNDFCSGGALPITEGETVIPVLNEWIKLAAAKDIPIFASRDWHPVKHMSFKDQGGLWPPHCIQDTRGARFHENLKLPEDAIIVTKGVRFDKDQNSAFDETGLDVDLKKFSISRLFIGGLALDVCVLKTVLDAIEHGFKTTLIKSGTQPVSKEGGEKALAQIAEAGAAIVNKPNLSNLEFCTMAPEWAEHARPNENEPACDDGRSGRIY